MLLFSSHPQNPACQQGTHPATGRMLGRHQYDIDKSLSIDREKLLCFCAQCAGWRWPAAIHRCAAWPGHAVHAAGPCPRNLLPAPAGARPDGGGRHAAGPVCPAHAGAPVRAGVCVPDGAERLPVRQPPCRCRAGAGGGLGLSVAARPVPGAAGSDGDQLRLDLPVPAGQGVSAGDLGDRPVHAGAVAAGVAAAPGLAGAGRGAGGGTQPAGRPAFPRRPPAACALGHPA